MILQLKVGENIVKLSSVNNYTEKPVYIESILYTGTQSNLKIINDFTGGFAQQEKDSSNLIIYSLADGDILIAKGEFVVKQMKNGHPSYNSYQLADFTERYEPLEKSKTPLDEGVRQYKKKPVKFNAIRYDGENIEEFREFTGGNIEKDPYFSDLILHRPDASPLRIKKGEYLVGTFRVYGAKEFVSRFELTKEKKSLDEHATQANLLRKKDSRVSQNFRYSGERTHY